jgi:hypothetical protein
VLIFKVKIILRKGDFMKKEFVNGKRVPHDAPMAKLKLMLASPIMMDFVLACEVLSERKDREAYELLKKYINDKDKYRRLCVLKTIFNHPESAEIIPWLEDKISSGEKWFAENGLGIVGELGIKINREVLISAVERELKYRYAYNPIKALSSLEVNEENFSAILGIFKKAAGSYQKEFLAEILCEKYLPEKASELFELFAVSDFAKVRIIAARIGRKYGFDLERLKYDENGHVRKIAEKGLGKLEFLRKYTGEYTVEFSKDLESAIIVNPYKDEHIEIDLDCGTDWEEYTVSFGDMHCHFDESEDAEEYIDDIISGKECSVCCLKSDESWVMSTSVEGAEIENLTKEKLTERFYKEWFEIPGAAKVIIRGFLPEYYYELLAEEKDGEVWISKKRRKN